MHDELLAVAVEREVAEAATEVKVVGQVERETTVGGSAESGGEVAVSSAPRVSASRRRSVTAESRPRRTGVESHHVLFGPLSKALRGITGALGSARLWLLLPRGPVAA